MAFQKTKFIQQFFLGLFLLVTVASCGNAGNGESVDGLPDGTNLDTLSITAPANASSYNATAANFNLTGTCSQDSAPLNFTINGSLSNSATCASNNFSFATTISSLAQGANTLTVTSSLTGSSASISIIYDSVTPTLTYGTFSVINSLNQGSYTFSGTCSEDGNISGTLGTIAISANCSSGSFSTGAVDLSSRPDGNLTASLSITDTAGNASGNFNDTVLKETVPPTITLDPTVEINDSNQSSYSLSGTCDEDGTLTGSFGALALSGNCSSGAFTLGPLNLSSESDGPVPLSITVTDGNGNPSNTISTTVAKDTNHPTVSLGAVDNVIFDNQNSYAP